MSFTIERCYGPVYKNLLQRPRISHMVSEYVFDFVNQQLLRPNRVLQSDKYIYKFTFSFSFSIPNRTFPYTSPFATGTRLFFGQKGFRTFDKIEKWATLTVVANDIDETITPWEYANVVFDMLANFLLSNYKKFDKAAFDNIRSNMDRSYIESFDFPASFDEQLYSFDDKEHPVIPLEHGYAWAELDKWVNIDPRVEYLKYYPF